MTSPAGREPDPLSAHHRALLRAWWFALPASAGQGAGVGISACSREDAEAILRAERFGGGALPGGIEVVEDVTLSNPDRNHVARNCGSLIFRGVWYPTVRRT